MWEAVEWVAMTVHIMRLNQVQRSLIRFEKQRAISVLVISLLSPRGLGGSADMGKEIWGEQSCLYGCFPSPPQPVFREILNKGYLPSAILILSDSERIFGLFFSPYRIFQITFCHFLDSVFLTRILEYCKVYMGTYQEILIFYY